MDDETLNIYNNALTASNHTNKTPFKSIGSNEKISLPTDGKNNKLVCNSPGIYAIMLAIGYKNGVADDINVSYRELDASYSMFILSSKLTDDTFFDYKTLRNADNFIAVATVNLYTTINVDSVFEGVNGTETIATSISDIHEKYPDMVFMDTATGWKIDYNLFESGKFTFNRNYVLYLTSK